MRTIPLKPIFENEKFQESTPVIKSGVISAIYWLSERDKLDVPLPQYLMPYIGLCGSSYYRYKDAIRIILLDVVPKIAKIKQHACQQTKNATTARVKKAAERRLERYRNVVLSDQETTHVRIAPVPPHSQGFNSGQYDPFTRAQAIANNAKAKKDVQVWFKDK